MGKMVGLRRKIEELARSVVGLSHGGERRKERRYCRFCSGGGGAWIPSCLVKQTDDDDSCSPKHVLSIRAIPMFIETKKRVSFKQVEKPVILVTMLRRSLPTHIPNDTSLLTLGPFDSLDASL